MPFGTIFGAIVFAALALRGLARVPLLPWGSGRFVDLLVGAAGIALALGLLMRQRWARWAGIAVSCLMTLVGAALVAVRGGAGDFAVFFGFVATAVLLAIPGTGDARRGLPPGARPFPRAGRIVGWSALAAVAVLGVALATTLVNGPPEGAAGEGRKDAAAARGRSDAVQWLDFGPALDRARASGKPVFVDFYATWCGPCKGMDRRTFRDPEVVKVLSSLVASRVDSEETTLRAGHRGVDLAERYRVEGYPTLVLLDSEGREISRRTGFVPAGEFVAWIDREIRTASSTAGSAPAGRS